MTEPRFRVLYIIDSLARSGAEQSLISMAPYILRRGVELEVAYLYERDGLRAELVSLGVPTHAITAPGSRLTRVMALSSLIRSRQPHLVHTTLFESDVAGRLAARLSRVPSVSSLVNVAYGPVQRRDVALRPIKVTAARWADRQTAKLSVRFHAITRHVADVMARELAIPPDRIDVIPRCRDRVAIGDASVARRAAVRSALGVQPSTIVVLAASRHEYQKGLDVLVEAMPSIVAAQPRALLLMAGREGNQTARLKRRIGDLGLSRHVRMLGMRADVPDLMAAADVFVLPSRWEGFGGVLVEAMALGAPVVATDLPPVREVIGELAFYCHPDDPLSLSSAILAALEPDSPTESRSLAGIERYELLYSAERVAGAMVRFYERTLAFVNHR